MHGELTDHAPQSLIANARKFDDAHGMNLGNEKYEFIEMPGAKNAVRITFSETDKSGKKQAYIYLVNTIDNVMLKMNCNGPWPTEPEAFNKMVKSLKMNDGGTKPPK